MIRDFFIVNLLTKEKFHKSYVHESTPASVVKKFLLKYSRERETKKQDIDPIKDVIMNQYMLIYLVKDDLMFLMITDLHDSKKDMELILAKLSTSLDDFKFGEPLSKIQKENLEQHITKILFSQIKIALIGKDDVGKSAIFNQLEGEISYSHSKRVMRSKLILSGSTDLKIYLLDYIGTEDYSPQWPNLLRGIHIILIVVDSTVENVLSTKRLFLNLVKKAKPDALILGIANKQDQPNALEASLVKKMLDIDDVFPLSMYRLTNIKSLENIFLHAVKKYLEQFGATI
jgi:small GTP-binding protein